VVTPRTLDAFKGKSLVLPNVRVLDEKELASLRKFVEAGGNLIATGTNSVVSLGSKVVSLPDCPGKAYIAQLKQDTAQANPASQQKLLSAIKYSPVIEIQASPLLVTSIAEVDGNPHIYFANFNGLRSGENAIPDPQLNVQVRVSNAQSGTLHVVPFMGTELVIRPVKHSNGMQFTIPRIERGAIAWIEGH
jgi:hypothetical protein